MIKCFQTINHRDIEVFTGLWNAAGPLRHDPAEISRVLKIPLRALVRTHITKNFHGRTPDVDELRYPFEGYINKPIKTSCIFEEYDLREIDIIYFVPQSAKKFVDLVDHLELTSLAKFELNGKVAEIYKLNIDD